MPDSEKLQDKDGSHWETIDSKIPRTLRHAVVRILGLFSGLPLRWQLICAVAGLTVAGFCGYYLQRILFNSQANLSRTLAATMVSTAYPHRGVTAFLVGELDKNVPSAKDDPTLKSAVEKIAEDINSLSNSDFPEQKQNQVLDELDFEVRDKPNLGHPEQDGGHTWTKIIQKQKEGTG